MPEASLRRPSVPPFVASGQFSTPSGWGWDFDSGSTGGVVYAVGAGGFSGLSQQCEELVYREIGAVEDRGQRPRGQCTVRGNDDLGVRVVTNEDDVTAALASQIAAWQSDRRNINVTIDGQFTTADARLKLRRLYPQIKD